MSKSTVVIATRKSALALAQARAWMASFREAAQVATEEKQVVTTGDRVQDRALLEIGGKGLFIKEIEEALLARDADCAVHSLKDVPAELAPGLRLACIPKREDARDVVRTRSGCSFAELPPGARVGTGSLRRSVQLKRLRPDLTFVPIRGNIDTRLRKCDEGEVDAVILAAAGMHRMNWASRYTEVFEAEVCLPAVGQGALAIEIREDDDELAALLGRVADRDTELAVAAERGLMLAVDGSCQVPVGGYALRTEEGLWLRGMLAESDGSRLRFDELRSPWPSTVDEAFECGRTLGERLKGA